MTYEFWPMPGWSWWQGPTYTSSTTNLPAIPLPAIKPSGLPANRHRRAYGIDIQARRDFR